MPSLESDESCTKAQRRPTKSNVSLDRGHKHIPTENSDRAFSAIVDYTKSKTINGVDVFPARCLIGIQSIA
jgi:hypothetical protein